MEIQPNRLGFHEKWLKLNNTEFDEKQNKNHKNTSSKHNLLYLTDPSKNNRGEKKEKHRRKNKSRVDSTKTRSNHSTQLSALFHNTYQDNLHLNCVKMPPISEKRSPTIIKENTKENIANSKTLCDKLSNRVPELLDFRESWLQEIDLYKDQLRAQQLLTQHNHIHTPDGCIRDSKDALKTTSEPIKRRLQSRSDSESNDVNRIRSMKDSDDHDLVLKRAREDNYLSPCNNSSNNQQQHTSPTTTTTTQALSTTAGTVQGTQNIDANGKLNSMSTSCKVIANPYHANFLLNSSQMDKTKNLPVGLDSNTISNNSSNSNCKPSDNKITNLNGVKQKTPKKEHKTNVLIENGLSSDSSDKKVESEKDVVNNSSTEAKDEEAKKAVNDDVVEKGSDVNGKDAKADDEYLSDYGDDDEVFDVDDEDVNYSDSEDEYKGDIFLIHTPKTTSKVCETEYTTPSSIFTPSLFPNVPPYLNFASHTDKAPSINPELQKILKWKLTSVMPKIVRRIIINSGCRLIKKTNEWMGTWEKHMKSTLFKTLRSYQKFNHLPGTFKIGRKDSVWRNLRLLMTKYSKREFGFMQKTYILPTEVQMLKKAWPRFAQRNTKWIIKPPASARGTGIKVISRWSQIPKTKPVIVQKYIERPFLIEGNKFDLRLYVVITSINPLRIYMYPDGLARFASVQYSDKLETLNDRCMHLTNYSINKLSANYAKNEDIDACQGHKWTLKSLWKYFHQRGINTTYLWGALRNLVIRTVISGEGCLNKLFKTNVNSRYNCYELFGFDVLLDEDLTPWLLEVNISPSLHSELPLDMHVKGPLVQAVLNTALYHVPPKLSAETEQSILDEYGLTGPLCYDKRMYVTHLSEEERKKHNYFTGKEIDCREEYLEKILDNITPDDLRLLIVCEDELARCRPLERIFPTSESYKYLDYIDGPRYYNRLLDAWENSYFDNRENGIKCLQEMCELKLHLKVTPIPTAKRSVEREIPDNTESTENGDNADTLSIDDDKNSIDNCDSVDDISEQQQKQPTLEEKQIDVQTKTQKNCHTQSANSDSRHMQINGGGPRPIAVETK